MSGLKRKVGLKRTGFKVKPGTPKFYQWKPGKKTRASAKANGDMKAECRRLGIFQCELHFDGCWRDPHGFAHSRKRRNIITPEQLREAVIACNHCHSIIERWPESKMGDFVREILARR
jgi:hypothetical protein